MKTTGRRYESEMDAPFVRSTDSHVVTPRHQGRTMSGKFLSPLGLRCLYDGAERRPGDGQCGRDGPAAG